MKVARDEIVMAARELFREKGYAGASMQDLAERVGLKKASLYMRFVNKEALVPEVMELLLRDTLTAAQPTGQDRTWYTAYEAVVRAIADSLSDRKRCVGLHLAYGVGDEAPMAKQAVHVFFQSLRDHMSSILAKAMSVHRAQILAADALARLEGATLMTAVFDDVETMKRAVGGVLADAKKAAQTSGSQVK